MPTRAHTTATEQTSASLSRQLSERRIRLNNDRHLSRHIVRTELDGETVLYNTVTKTALAADVSHRELAAAHGLAGQELDAIKHAVLAPRTTLTLTIVVTWECTLRCTHCSVLKKLVRKQDRFVDNRELACFVRR
ncbi:MAG: hypothetical protein JSV80_14950, partial [Acidobacteriota bacterium]